MGREGTSEAGGYAGCSVCVAGSACVFGIAGRRVHEAAEQAPLWWAYTKGGGGPRRVLTHPLRHDPTPSSDRAKQATRAETRCRCRSERERRGGKAHQKRAGMHGAVCMWRAMRVHLLTQSGTCIWRVSKHHSGGHTRREVQAHGKCSLTACSMIPGQAAPRPSKRHEQRRDTDAKAKEREGEGRHVRRSRGCRVQRMW